MVVMSERLEKRLGATLAVFPPLIFARTTSVSLFRVSSPPPRENASGVFIYSFLGQDVQSGTKMDGIGGPMIKWT
jgi:hypothetical protein